MDVREQRVSFVVTACRGERSFTALCKEFGITRPTGYLWLSRYREAGIAGIAERSRRPASSPDRTAMEVEGRVVELRQQYPDWGARKLQVLLQQRGLDLARSTWLLRGRVLDLAHSCASTIRDFHNLELR
jgi:transposase